MPAPLNSIRRLVALSLLALAGLSCIDSPTGLATLGSVSVTPEAISLRPLDTARLTVVVRSVDGTITPVPIVDWVSLDTAVARVDSMGLVTASAYAGPLIRNTKLVVASLGARSDTVPVEVLPLAVARARVLTDTIRLSPRDSAVASVLAESEAGVPLTGRATAWASSDTAALEVRNDGRLRAKPYLGPLTRTVFAVAFVEGKADTAVVVISPLPIASLRAQPDSLTLRPSQLDTLEAIARTAGGERLELPPLIWRSTDTSIVRTNEEGVLTASFYSGPITRSASIIVEGGAFADTVPVRVLPYDAARIITTPDSVRVFPGRGWLLTAFVIADNCAVLDGRNVTWSSADTAVATIDSTGLATAKEYGGIDERQARLIASVNGRADTTVMIVRPHVARFIVATPEAVSLYPGDSVEISAELLSASLTSLRYWNPVWRALDSRVASATNLGFHRGMLRAEPYLGPERRFTILTIEQTTLSDGVIITAADTVPVEVLPLAAARIDAAVDSIVLGSLDTATLAATVRDARGLALEEREITWVAGDTAVARVTPDGRVSVPRYVGPLERRTLATVFSEGRADSVTIIVRPQTPSVLSVGPDSLELLPSQVDTLSSLLTATSGDTLREFSILWSSTDTTVARVNEEGVVTATYYVGAEARRARIVARLGALADTGLVVVAPLPIGRVAITPDTASVAVGAEFRLDAVVEDGVGTRLADRPVTWSSLDPALATVNDTGLVTALQYGGPDLRVARIVASAGDLADTISLRLIPNDVRWIEANPAVLALSPRDTATITPTLLSLNLAPLSGREVAFASLDTSVARVSPSGLVTAAAYTGPTLRATSILVSSGSAADTVPVSVTPLAAARVIASPDTVAIAVGDSAALAARVEAIDGTTLTGRSSAWLSSDTTTMTVSADGVVRARPYTGPLTRRVFAIVFAEGFADSVAVTVTPQQAARVILTPATLSLRPGAVDTIDLRVESANGTALTEFPVTWTSTDTTVLRVNAEGVVTAGYYVGASTRAASVIASSGALADTTSISVLPLSAANVSIIAPDSLLVPSATMQLDAQLRDASGLLLEGRALTWTTSDATVATVSGSGLVTASVYGGAESRSVFIVASTEGVADTVTLRVPPHPVAWVTATPEALSLSPFDTATVAVALASLDLTPLSDRAVQWRSLDTSIVTASDAGLVTARPYLGAALRTSALIVTSGTAVDTVPITVTALPIAAVIATPASVTLSPNDTVTLSAVARSVGGLDLTGRSFTWLVSDTSIVTVDAGGRLQARPYLGALARTTIVEVYADARADTVAVTVQPLAAASLTLATQTLTLAPGDTSTLAATVRSADGDVLAGVPITWSSTDTTIARVNVAGTVTAGFYAGPLTRSTSIIATTGALADTTLLTITPLSVASVAIVAPDTAVSPGATLQLDATLRDAAGLILEGRTLAWTSSDAAIASVSASGLVTAVTYGGAATRAVTIIASSGGVADTITLTLPPLVAAWATATPEALTLAPSDTARLSVAVQDINLTPLSGRSVEFSSLDTTIATVAIDGLVRAVPYAGSVLRTTTIVVRSGAATDSVPVTVTAIPVGRVTASPATLALSPNDTATLSAVATSAAGLALTGRIFAWIAGDTNIVTVSEQGLLRAKPYVGPLTRQTVVFVFSEGAADTVAVTVLPQTPSALALTPGSVALLPGDTASVQATALAASGDTLTEFAITYASSDTAVARVNAAGVVTASFYVGALTREARIVASLGAIADTAAVVVSPLVPNSIVLSAPDSLLAPGATLQLDASVRDAANLLLEGRTLTWSSSDAAIATVSASGLVSAASYGGPATRTVSIVATIGAIADTVTLTVPPLAAAWATATPEALSLAPTDTARIAVALQDINLAPLTGRSITFTSLDSAIASVTSDGLVTATAYTGPSLRSTSVVVTSGAAADTVPVSVTPLTVQRVTAAPATVTLAPSDTATLSAAATTSTGLGLTDRAFTWIAGDTNVVTVSAAGFLRAKAYTGPLTRSTVVFVFSEGVADTVDVTVTPQSPSALTLSPSTLTLMPADTATLSAVSTAASGDTLTDVAVSFASSDTTVARVNSAGTITASFYVGAATRSATIFAATGGLADTTAVTVLPLVAARVAIAAADTVVAPGATLQLDASVRDAADLLLEGRTLTWTSSDPAIASVSATGLVTAATYGGPDARSVAITVSTGSVADTMTLTLPALVPAWATATPEALSVAPGDTARLSVAISDINLTPLSGRSVTFATLDASVATVSSEGLVTASYYTGPALRSTSIVVTSGAATDTVPVSVTPFAVQRVTASPPSLTLSPSDTATLSASLSTLSGIVLSGRSLAWISGDTNIVTVSNDGLVQSKPYTGSLTRNSVVFVFSEGVADTVNVSVTPQLPTSLALSPSTLALLPGDTASVSALTLATSGDTLTDLTVNFASSDTTVARVNAAGVVTASFYVGPTPRTAQVIASLAALADTTEVTVNPLAPARVAITAPDTLVAPGATLQLDASVRDANDLLLEGRTLAWTSSNTSIATVSATGLVSAGSYGGPETRNVSIVVSVEGIADTIALTLPPLSAVWATATPEALSLVPRDSAQLSVALSDINLVPLTGRSVTFASLDPSIASVTADGLVIAEAYTGPTLRSTSIIVTSGAATDTVPVSVAPLAVARVVAAPDTVTIGVGNSTPLSVSAFAADSTPLSGRSFLWLTSDSSVATLDAAGLVTATAYAGADERTALAVVYSDGIADSVVVRVSALPPSSISFGLDSLRIRPGAQDTLIATVRAAGDLTLSGVPLTWSSSDPSIVTVNAEGIVTGLYYVGAATRSVTIIASTGTIADTATVVVDPLSVASIAVFPDTQTVKPNQTAQLSAVLRDSANLFLEDRSITWSSSDTTLATVDAAGLVRTRRAGLVTMTAVSEGVADTVTLDIVHPAISVDVTPSLATIWIGRTQQFTATPRDSVNAALSDRAITWASSNTNIATVSATGLVTAIAEGLVTITAEVEGVTRSVEIDVFPEPSAAITITFDDAWRGVLTLAAPRLDSLRLRANVGWITNVDWAGVMTPDELRQLQNRGWSILSHSMTHPRLTDISLDSAAVELSGSRNRIASLGFDPRVMIVPYLAHNNDVLAASAAAGYTYTRCCAQDVWTTDTLVQWPIQESARHRLAGVDVTDYDGQVTTYNFRTADGRTRLRSLLEQVVAEGKFIDVFFHDIVEEDIPDLKLTLEILADFRRYLITYAALP